MMMFATLIQLGFLAILGSAAPSPAPRGVSCALCPQADLAGEPIVASSGGTQGVPDSAGQFSPVCMFQANATENAAPTTICFYGPGGGLSYASTELCPPTTELYSPCPVVP
ncbi:hypothetical protein CPB85DRAFT_1457060 [Mucidula mucida]|nr:hypothetical protein CPB85DRAFT_1457060 [Mucidula mucida]